MSPLFHYEGAPAAHGRQRPVLASDGGRIDDAHTRFDESVRMPYLWRHNHGIFFDDRGSGPAIITCHGYAESGMYWSRTGVSDGLVAAGYRVIDMDMRGHGRSVPIGDDPGYHPDVVAADFGALADHLGLGRFHILAHATSGHSALRYAFAHGERLLSLMATNTGSAPDARDEYTRPEYDDVLLPIPEPRPRGRTPSPSRSVAENMVAARAGDGGQFLNRLNANPDPDRCWQWTTEILTSGNPEYKREFGRLFYLDANTYARRLQQIRCPCLVLLGEHDVKFIKPSEQLARCIPGAEHVVMPGLGHMLAIEQPQATLAELLRFLRALP